MTRGKITALVMIALLLLAAVWWATRSPQPASPQATKGRRGGDIAPLVLVTQARVQDVPVWLDAAGTAAAAQSVVIRPQVEGRLIKIAFKEGQMVKAGDVLALIDPVTYRAQLEQVEAKKAQNEALLANAKLDLARYEKLAKDRAASVQQVDTQRALVAQLQAQTRLDQAAIENARALLSYTTITAPISGRVGIRQVDEGNLVRMSDVNGLVTLAQLDPILVNFSLPQQQLAQVSAAITRAPPPVTLALSANGRVEITGTLDVIDNQVDQQTGTVRMKASFSNPQGLVWPGQYVSLRVQVDVIKNALTLPLETVQRGPTGSFVYTVDDKDTIAVKPVTLLRDADGLAVLASTDDVSAPGLTRVVTTGFSQLFHGAKVRLPTKEDAAGTNKAAVTPPSVPRP